MQQDRDDALKSLEETASRMLEGEHQRDAIDFIRQLRKDDERIRESGEKIRRLERKARMSGYLGLVVLVAAFLMVFYLRITHKI